MSPNLIVLENILKPASDWLEALLKSARSLLIDLGLEDEDCKLTCACAKHTNKQKTIFDFTALAGRK